MSGIDRTGVPRDDHWGSRWLTAGVPDVPGFAQLRLVGSGGSASVYRAVELRHDRPVAIKILDVQAGDSQKRAFNREVEAIARIEPHPNVITLLGSGVTPNGHPYLVFPFFDSGTFAEWIDERGPLTWSAAADIAIKICAAVETVHRAGLIHRDVKPANVFIGVTPAHPVLGDFGISTLVEGIPTRTVKQAVTVGYTAPEILHDEPATTVSDVYSLGMSIFRIIQGLHAYYAESPAAVMRNVLNQSDAPHLSAGVPPSLDEAVTRALAQNPADRPQTALELARDLQAVQADHYLPVTPVLVTGEPGVLGEDEPSPAVRASPARSDSTTETVFPTQPIAEEPPPSLLEPQPGADVEQNPPQGEPAIEQPLAEQPTAEQPAVERPEAGAILAAAVNDDTQSSAGTATEATAAPTIDKLPAADSPPQTAVKEDNVPKLPRPLSRDANKPPPGRRPRMGRISLPDQRPPGSLDMPTQSRIRRPRSDLLAPKVPTKKSRWWSKLARKSGNA